MLQKYFTLQYYFFNPLHLQLIQITFQVDIDFEKEPIGTGKDGKSVYFKDIWPSTEEIAEVGRQS